MEKQFEIAVTSLNDLPSLIPGDEHPLILILTQTSSAEGLSVKDGRSAIRIIGKWRRKKETKSILFISGKDAFTPETIAGAVHRTYEQTPDCKLALFVPYKSPPQQGLRDDGKAGSFLVSTKHLKRKLLIRHLFDFPRLAYELTQAYLNSDESTNIEIRQIGKDEEAMEPLTQRDRELLQRSLLIIPHMGPLKLLKRCLRHLVNTPFLPARINLCFDDKGYKRFKKSRFSGLQSRLKIFRNNPENVGPYPARHYSILNTDMDNIFFQDSDDISFKGRFEKQIKEMQRRGLDMIGSHELRIDEFRQAVIAVRYPLDANRSMDDNRFHALFHPTSMITRDAYLRTGGFSTNLRFAYDSQFLLRSHFFIRSGNIDDFLYIRFKRANSLTTDPKTRLGTELRTFLLWRWKLDFKFITENKLDLQDSSLRVQRHSFDYEFIEMKKNDE